MAWRLSSPGIARILFLLAAIGSPAAAQASGDGDEEALLLEASTALCDAGPLSGNALSSRLNLPPPLLEQTTAPRPGLERRHLTFAVPGGGRLEMLRFAARNGSLLRLDVIYHEPLGEEVRPRLLLVTGPGCRPLEGRRLLYGDGRPVALEILAPDLQALRGRELLEPALPDAPDPGGVPVAIVDSGVAYDLPQIAGRLARDAGGALVGYDFWDLDPLPYDANPAQSPFHPQRHGTEVASLLLAEAPKARLVPYRYPRPDMTRMAALVEHAAEAGARIIAMPLGSRSKAEWEPFAAAAARHPHLLFIVSAGNDGRDLDRDPLYPASLPLENLLVVSSSTADGRLAEGSSWGQETVDLLLPAEGLAVFDHLGRERLASGTSYAVPRLAALAARLAGANPSWQASEIKAALLARAEPTPQQPPPVKFGWIPEPARD